MKKILAFLLLMSNVVHAEEIIARPRNALQMASACSISNQLISTTDATNHLVAGVCMGYLEGILYLNIESKSFCIPPTKENKVVSEEIWNRIQTDLAMKFAAEKMPTLSYPVVMIQALHNLYPCKK